MICEMGFLSRAKASGTSAQATAINKSRRLGILEARSDLSARMAREENSRNRNLDSRAMSKGVIGCEWGRRRWANKA